MQVRSLWPLMGLLVTAPLATPATALADDFSTTASGNWRFVPALSSAFGVQAGMPALVFEQLALPFGVERFTDEDDEEEGGFLERSRRYMIVAAGLAGSAYLASELFDGSGPAGIGSPPGGTSSSDPTGPIGPTGPTPLTDPTQPPPPETAVPEPFTMTLLATGLAGIGGARLRRRRHLDA